MVVDKKIYLKKDDSLDITKDIIVILNKKLKVFHLNKYKWIQIFFLKKNKKLEIYFKQSLAISK